MILIVLTFACLKPAVLNDLPKVEQRTKASNILSINQGNQGSDCDGRMVIEGTDTWHSNWMRMLTPLKSSTANFVAKWSDQKEEQSLTIMPDTHYLFNAKAKKWTEANTDKTLGNATRIYIESLMLYLSIHFMSPPLHAVEYQGQETINETVYHRVFFTIDSTANMTKRDHYRAYIHSDTNLIEFIAFTYRDLYGAYMGVMHLTDYRVVGNRLHPHVIAIQDSIDSAKPVHTIAINGMACFSQAN